LNLFKRKNQADIVLIFMFYVFMLDEQKNTYNRIMEAVTNEKGGVFFLYGYGGTGKTYMWNTLASYLRSRREIVLNVATSGIAAGWEDCIQGSKFLFLRFNHQSVI